MSEWLIFHICWAISLLRFGLLAKFLSKVCKLKRFQFVVFVLWWTLITFSFNLCVVQILEKLGMKDEYCPLVKDWMVQRVIPNHKAIMALENKPLVNTDEPSQVHDEKDSEDLVKNIINKAVENPLKVTIKYRHRISLYSSNIPFHKWKVLADFD